MGAKNNKRGKLRKPFITLRLVAGHSQKEKFQLIKLIQRENSKKKSIQREFIGASATCRVRHWLKRSETWRCSVLFIMVLA